MKEEDGGGQNTSEKKRDGMREDMSEKHGRKKDVRRKR